MAKATKHTETKTFITGYTLELTPDEAQYLVDLLGPLAGSTNYAIYSALHKTGMSWKRRVSGDLDDLL